MNRGALAWIVSAVAVLGVAVVSVLLGLNLMPSRIVAQAKGTIVPWALTWGMLWMAALIAVALAASLFATGLNTRRRSS
jgi:hypothetical protein